MQVLCARTCADGWQGLDVTEKYRMPLVLLKITPHREVSDKYRTTEARSEASRFLKSFPRFHTEDQQE